MKKSVPSAVLLCLCLGLMSLHNSALADGEEGHDHVKNPGYHAYTESDFKKLEIIMTKIAKPLLSKTSLYRYGSAKFAPKNGEFGPLTQKEFERYMLRGRPGVSKVARAGRGQYLSGNIFDASNYAIRPNGDVAELTKLTIKEGTPYIDANDPSTLSLMKEYGISRDDLFYLDPPALVKYHTRYDWYALKALEGVRYEPITLTDLGGQDPKAQQRMRSRLKNIQARQIFDRHLQEALTSNSKNEGQIYQICETPLGSNLEQKKTQNQISLFRSLANLIHEPIEKRKNTRDHISRFNHEGSETVERRIQQESSDSDANEIRALTGISFR